MNDEDTKEFAGPRAASSPPEFHMVGLHFDRVAGRHRHHRDPRQPDFAGALQGERPRPAHARPEQREASPAGQPSLRRRQQ